MSPLQGFDYQRGRYQGLRPWLHDLAPPGPAEPGLRTGLHDLVPSGPIGRSEWGVRSEARGMQGALGLLSPEGEGVKANAHLTLFF